MSTSIQSTIDVSFDTEGNTCAAIRLAYRFERNVVELRQGDNTVSIPFEDAADFVAILRKWVEENT